VIGEKKKLRVYVAGSLSGTSLQYLENMRRMMRVATILWELGLSPYCPCLDYHYAFMRSEGREKPTVQRFYDASLQWVEVSDALLVLPLWENSKGTTGEIYRAHGFHVPVFLDPGKLLKYVGLNPDRTLDALFQKWEGEPV
jgi:hypothetical protein